MKTIDPIFAAIDRHEDAERAASAAVVAADNKSARQSDLEAVAVRALAAEDAAVEALDAIEPTTIAGFRALRAYERRIAA